MRWVLTATLMAVTVIAGLSVPRGGESRARTQDRQLTQTDPARASNSKRIALVVGNGAYKNAPTLKNPPNDARAMSAMLQSLGFEVTSGINTNQRELKGLIRDFGRRLKAGGSGLFYYAGHGVQSKGRNFLIPIEADIQSEADVEDTGVDVSLVLNYMDDAQNGLNIVIMDACRNNPFARSFRSASSGLAQVDAPTGTLIAYATAPGRIAADGSGENGLYTSELLKAMRVPGLSATAMFMRVRKRVMKKTAKKQVPWESSSLVGDFYFSEQKNDRVPAPAGSSAGSADTASVESDYWDGIKESNEATEFQAYLKEFPTGRHAPLARMKLKRIEALGKSGATSDATISTPGGGSTALKRVVQNPAGIDLVLIQPGSFQMGSTNGGLDEKPVHPVTIGYRFYIGRTEVTQVQWRSVMGNNPSHFKGDDLPVEEVSRNDVQAFIQKLNQLEDGYFYRLPSEAEWEYACRGGLAADYAGDFDQVAWYGNNSGTLTHPVGSKVPNNFGLYDMHGNVWEWCADSYHSNYEGAPTDGSAWVAGGEQKTGVLRGGSWGSTPDNLRSTFRGYVDPDGRLDAVGFRIVAVART